MTKTYGVENSGSGLPLVQNFGVVWYHMIVHITTMSLTPLRNARGRQYKQYYVIKFVINLRKVKTILI
jgi:hypothetical protein